MKENYQLIVIDPADLTTKVLEERRKNNRLIQICAVSTEGGYELSYSFAEGYDFRNYRLIIAEDVEIPSSSDLFPSAALYENEMKELFGVNIQHISLDYQNKLYKIDVETPFKK